MTISNKILETLKKYFKYEQKEFISTWYTSFMGYTFTISEQSIDLKPSVGGGWIIDGYNALYGETWLFESLIERLSEVISVTNVVASYDIK